MIDNNVEYYNKNADLFFESSIDADMSDMRDRFLKFIPDGGKLLDAGCGCGRDSKAFHDAGYEVIAFDASEEMCKMASAYIGRSVRNLRFEEIDYDGIFDGVWACASLLHVTEGNLPNVMERIYRSLKPGGVLYASFKYGEGVCIRGDRSFIDFDEKSIISLLVNAGFAVLSVEIGNDSRVGREQEKWVNAIGKKKIDAAMKDN
ncbi:class I SAM-dependent methyltransferase [Butyrivibrio sp. VCD2006]|uniref:class I SAM-dependent methyltransferase n=1 Tax=Butyrivibrio sp. VCD2006 TaxID=1280664 RepID=UPI00041DE5C3|nr:class I SAM-dependent methyltransferase [Butyrivibrio sp. VCD2006]